MLREFCHPFIRDKAHDFLQMEGYTHPPPLRLDPLRFSSALAQRLLGTLFGGTKCFSAGIPAALYFLRICSLRQSFQFHRAAATRRYGLHRCKHTHKCPWP